MGNLISSRQSFDIRRILDLYTDTLTASKRPDSFVRYAKMQAPISISIYRAREGNGSYLIADRDGARSTTWSADTLAQLDSVAPLEKRYHRENTTEEQRFPGLLV